MTIEELIETKEMDEFCLLNDYTVTYNRWLDKYVFDRDGKSFTIKESVDIDALFEAVRESPENNVLADRLEIVEFEENEEL